MNATEANGNAMSDSKATGIESWPKAESVNTPDFDSIAHPPAPAPHVAPRDEPDCAWSEDDLAGYWETGCGRTFTFEDGGPKENGANFCYHCGRVLRICADTTPPVAEEPACGHPDLPEGCWRVRCQIGKVCVNPPAAPEGLERELPLLLLYDGDDPQYVQRTLEQAAALLQSRDATIEGLRVALQSIAANTCCDRCQEAALVARAALAKRQGG